MTAKKKYDYKPYPEPDARRTGCKVSWYYYKKREDADACAVAAKHNARIQESLGYDFGYCSPGSITEVIGMFEVCLP